MAMQANNMTPQLGSGGLHFLSNEDEAPVNQESGPFYANLLQQLEQIHPDLQNLVAEVMEEVEHDIQVHEPYITKIAKTIENLGLDRSKKVTDTPNPGSSNVADPSLLKAGIDITSRIMGQFWNNNKPVKTMVMGSSTPIKMQKSQRVGDFMSWQLNAGIPGYYEQDDMMFTHLPFIGTAFKKMYFDSKRIKSEFISPADVFVPYEASSLDEAERITHLMRMSQLEYKKLVRSGFYEDLRLRPSYIEENKINIQNNAIMGAAPPPEPKQYELFECHCYLELDKLYPGMGPLPFIITYQKDTKKLVRVSRNWDQADPDMERAQTFINYKFSPWQGVYGIGLGHTVGNLSDTASDILNQLIDAGQKQNMLTGIKLHNDQTATSGNQLRLQDGTFADFKVGPQITDIRQVLMRLDMAPPSQTLYQLYGDIQTQISSLAGTNSQLIPDTTVEAAAATTYMLISERYRVYNSIFKRQHMSKAQEYKILHQLNYKHLDDQITKKVFGGELVVNRMDFDDDVSVVPTSDPTCSSVAEKTARLQMISDYAKSNPGAIDSVALTKMFFDTLGVPDLETLLPPTPPPPQPRDPWANIQSIMAGNPTQAFPEQAPLADQHLAFYNYCLKDPSLGQNKYLVQTGFTYKLGVLMQQFQSLRMNNMMNTAVASIQQGLSVNQPQQNQSDMVGLTAPPYPPEVETQICNAIMDPHLLQEVMECNKHFMDSVIPLMEESLKLMPPQPIDPDMVKAIAQRDKTSAETAHETSRIVMEAEEIASKERIATGGQDAANWRALVAAFKDVPADTDVSQIPASLPVNVRSLVQEILSMQKIAKPPVSPIPPSTGQEATGGPPAPPNQ